MRIPFPLWDYFGLEQRTNNNVETWHNSLNKYIRPRLPFYQFVTSLIQECKRQQHKMRERALGAALPPKNAIYAGVNTQMRTLFNEIDGRTPANYLAALGDAFIACTVNMVLTFQLDRFFSVYALMGANTLLRGK